MNNHASVCMVFKPLTLILSTLKRSIMVELFNENYTKNELVKNDQESASNLTKVFSIYMPMRLYYIL